MHNEKLRKNKRFNIMKEHPSLDYSSVVQLKKEHCFVDAFMLLSLLHLKNFTELPVQ